MPNTSNTYYINNNYVCVCFHVYYNIIIRHIIIQARAHTQVGIHVFTTTFHLTICAVERDSFRYKKSLMKNSRKPITAAYM